MGDGGAGKGAGKGAWGGGGEREINITVAFLKERRGAAALRRASAWAECLKEQKDWLILHMFAHIHTHFMFYALVRWLLHMVR